MPATSLMATLGSEVRARRASLGLSQQNLADLSGVSERFVRFVETGKSTVQLEPLLAVLDTLGLELSLRQAARRTASETAP